MASQGFTRDTGNVGYQQFSTQGIANPAYSAIGQLVGVAEGCAQGGQDSAIY